MRVALGAALALLAVSSGSSLAAPGGAGAAASGTFDNWTATCDNLRDCVAIGSSDDGDGLFYVRIARDGAGSSAAKVKVVLAASDPIPGPPDAFRLTLVAKGSKTGEVFTAAAKKADTDGAALAATIPDAAFLAAIEKAETLDYLVGTSKGRLALKGLDPALRFIDDHQGRAGTMSALIARGMTPAATTPAPVVPTIQPATVAAEPVASPMLGRALLDMAKPACDPEVVEAHNEAAAWSLGADRRLVAVPCTESPDNVSVALFTTDAKGEQPRPAMLEEPPKQGDAEAENVVVNYGFDAKTLTLSGLDKGRGLGDCGSARTWVWNGEVFALLKASELEACPGALPEDWPPVYQAVRK